MLTTDIVRQKSYHLYRRLILSRQVVPLPRVSSELLLARLAYHENNRREHGDSSASDAAFGLTPLQTNFSTLSATSSSLSSPLSVTLPDHLASSASNSAIATPVSVSPSPLSPLPTPSASSSSSSSSSSSALHALPYALPSNKMGSRICGCPEISACLHKDPLTGKPLPSYEVAYAAWRHRTDFRALLSTVVWVIAQKLMPKKGLAFLDGAWIRRAAAVFIQLCR